MRYLASVLVVFVGSMSVTRAQVVPDNVWLADAATSRVYRVAQGDGALLGSFALPAGVVPGGVGLTAGNLWVLDVGVTPPVIHRLNALTGVPLAAPVPAADNGAVGVGAGWIVGAGNPTIEFFLSSNTAPGELQWRGPFDYRLINRCNVGLVSLRGLAAAPTGGGGTGTWVLRVVGGSTELWDVDKLTCARRLVATYGWVGWGLGANASGAVAGLANELFAADLTNGLVRVLNPITGAQIRQFGFPAGVTAVRGVASGNSCPRLDLAFADFKIFPGVATQFDQTCTSFTSRCTLGSARGEILQEFPMRSRDVNGGATDFFRGIGETSVGFCEISNLFYLTQDQNCADQESYRVKVRGLDAGGSGPDASGVFFDSGPLLTPPNGAPGACAWGINLTFTTAGTVPCDTSWFVGMELADAATWVANGQSLQGAWYTSGTIGDVPSAAAPEISWQIDAFGSVGQCGTSRVWDLGVSVDTSALNLANIHGDARCGVDPAPGAGGLWPSNSARGDGLAMVVRDSLVADGTSVASFLSFSPSPIPIPLPGILQKSLWIGPAPLIQVSFGSASTLGGVAYDAPAALAPTRLSGIAGSVWLQSAIATGLPVGFTNAAAALLDPIR